MEDNSNTLNEIKQLSPFLYELKKGSKNPFIVPKDYFNDFKNTIVLYAVSFNRQKPTTNDIPSGYFENFADDLISKIKSIDSNKNEVDEEFSEIALSISHFNLKQGKPFLVPENYFEENKGALIEKIKTDSKKPVKLKPLMNREKIKPLNFIRAASVAAAIFLLCIVGLQFLSKPINSLEEPCDNTTDLFACLSEKEILNYLDYYVEDIDENTLYNETSNDVEKLLESDNIDNIEDYINEYIEDIDESMLFENLL